MILSISKISIKKKLVTDSIYTSVTNQEHDLLEESSVDHVDEFGVDQLKELYLHTLIITNIM